MSLRMRAVAALLPIFSTSVFSQSAAPASPPKPPTFEVADVRVSPHRAFASTDGGNLYGERYVLREATMLDLISRVYGLDRGNVQGGPSWLEWDRFEITAKASAGTPAGRLKLMLRSLLEDRFGLTTHAGTTPLPAYVLTAKPGGKPKMRASDGTGEGSCIQPPQTGDQTASGVPYNVIQCRNVTMAAFAATLRSTARKDLPDPVVDSTDLKGSWDFELKWIGKERLREAGPDKISVFDAVSDQLGLNLELKTIPSAVLIVDEVRQQPTANLAGVEKLLPPAPPARFEVGVVKPSKPDAKIDGRIRGGEINFQSFTLKNAVSWAWDLNWDDNEVIVGAPGWFNSDKFDFHAKAASDTYYLREFREMMRQLLTERFQIKAHTEDRPVSSYTLIAANPKLKKADPLSRTHCIEGPGPDGKDPRIANPILNRLVTCQNISMTQFGDELQRIGTGYIYNSILDATGLEGSWDFTLSFSGADLMKGAGALPPSAETTSTDPDGALSLFNAINKELERARPEAREAKAASACPSNRSC